MIIPAPPSAIEQTKIFERITQSDSKYGLLNLANSFIKSANPIADSIIAGPFQKYTLHNRDHIKKVLHIAGYIISQLTLENLNPAECLILLYAAYMHDMGMAVTDEEYKNLIVDPGYLESIEKWPEMQLAFTRVREKIAAAKGDIIQVFEAEIADLQKAALANYLRPLHASKSRYRNLIQILKSSSGKSDLFEINGQSFETELVSICESHNLSATVLGEIVSPHQDKYPRALPIGGFHVNVQFICAILRLSDILDFDYERTPNLCLKV